MENNKKNSAALHITQKAKKSRYIGCTIEGVKDEGQSTTMMDTNILHSAIKDSLKTHPLYWFIGLIITLVGFLASMIEIYQFLFLKV